MILDNVNFTKCLDTFLLSVRTFSNQDCVKDLDVRDGSDEKPIFM